MSNIIPYTPKLDYLELHSGEKIKQITVDSVYSKLRNILKIVYVVSGQDKNLDDKGTDLNIQTSLFANDLKNKFSNLTLEEVSELMNRGVRKEFGEYYGLNVVTFNDWAKAFITLPERHNSLKTAHTLKEKELSVDDIEKINKDAITTMIDTYKRTKQVLNYGNAKFLYLWNTKQLRFGKTQQEMYLIQAERNVNKYLSEELQRAKDGLKKNDVKRIDAEIAELIAGENPSVKAEAANLALIDWIEKL